MTDKFDSAEFYDCEDSEVLAHGEPEEAIEAFLEGWMEPGCDTMAIIDEHSPITVTAHNPETVTEDWARDLAVSLLDRISEDFHERFGNPDGDGDSDEVDAQDLNALLPDMTALVMRAVSTARVWRCEVVGRREYSVDEVEAMMRERDPEWFQ